MKDNTFKVLSISDYRSFFSRQILLDFKLGGHKEYVPLIARVYEQNLKNYFDMDIVLVPIPCSPSSYNVRGYNHMQLICDCLTSYKTFDILSNRGTMQQKHLTRIQRIEASKNKFFLKDSLLPYDSKIVLVDDITTTGASLDTCQKLLIEAGYTSVSAITWFIEF